LDDPTAEDLDDQFIVDNFQPDSPGDEPSEEEKKNRKLPARDGRFQIVNGLTQSSSSLLLTRADLTHLKNVRFREQYITTLFGIRMNTTDPLERQKLLRLLSVTPNTFRGYASHWNLLRKNNCRIDFSSEGLCKFLAIRGGLSNASLSHWGAAVKFHMHAVGHSSCSEEELFRVLSKGYCHDNPNGLAKVRGVITRAKIETLATSPHLPPAYQTGFRAQFALGLRTSQMSSVCASEIETIMDKKGKTVIGYIYVTMKQKDMNAHMRKSHECHILDPADTAFMTSLLDQARASGEDRLFPFWNESQANKLIKLCAKTYGWDPKLEWVNHGIRHGACLEAAENAPDQSDAGRILNSRGRTAQNSACVVRDRYCKSETARDIEADARLALTSFASLTKKPAAPRLATLSNGHGVSLRVTRKNVRVSLAPVGAVVSPTVKNRRQTIKKIEQASAKKSKTQQGALDLDACTDLLRKTSAATKKAAKAVSQKKKVSVKTRSKQT
jgi:hypothetical protein